MGWSVVMIEKRVGMWFCEARIFLVCVFFLFRWELFVEEGEERE